jgi:hypothetical protein
VRFRRECGLGGWREGGRKRRKRRKKRKRRRRRRRRRKKTCWGCRVDIVWMTFVMWLCLP